MTFQYDLNFTNELIVDNFAGGGGASIGIEMGTNRFVDIAINHDKTALYVHELNHPNSLHLPSDVFEVNPIAVCQGRPVGLAWFSPDCRHFSKAKGGKPVEKKIRGLAWVTRRWAKTVRPRIIVLENVEEFLTWGPTITTAKGEKPDPKRAGLTFNAFNAWFLRNGYKTEWKIKKACDFGAPTTRKRLVWIARCDDRPIIWPISTHGPKNSIQVKKKKLKPFRTAAECIDWSIPCPSIFMNQQEAKEYTAETGIKLKRPLADATLKRVAKGIVKFVLADPKPFIVSYYGDKKDGDFRGHRIDDPLKTQTTENRFALCTPFMARQFGQSIGHKADDPTGSITAGGMGKTQLVNVAIAPMVARQFKTGVCHSVNQPMATVMAGGGGGKNQLVSATLIQTGYGERDGQQPRVPGLGKPLGTVVASGPKHALVSAFLAKHYTGVTGSKLNSPIDTITSIDHHSLVSVSMAKKDIESGADCVSAFLLKYYGTNIGQDLRTPTHTITSNDRFGLVTVHIKGEPWVIVDIGIRMLQPHELMIAQGFPSDYQLGDISKTAKVRLIGNSVPPPLAAAIVNANYSNQHQLKATA